MNIKSIIVTVSLIMAIGNAFSQSKDVMERRAKDFIEALNSGNRETYKKFIMANYTPELIAKKMNRKVVGSDDPAANSNNEEALTSKLNMFDQIHQDVGKAKIASMKQNGDMLDVAVTGDTGVNLNFGFTFLKDAPNLINAVSVQLTR